MSAMTTLASIIYVLPLVVVVLVCVVGPMLIDR